MSERELVRRAYILANRLVARGDDPSSAGVAEQLADDLADHFLLFREDFAKYAPLVFARPSTSGIPREDGEGAATT